METLPCQSIRPSIHLTRSGRSFVSIKLMMPLDGPIEATTQNFCTSNCFHGCLEIPASAGQRMLFISYADIGAQNQVEGRDELEATDVPTILYMSGVGGAMGYANLIHKPVRKMGVRMLIVDRFGYGLTTNVPVEERVDQWLRIVPILLQHLKIKHVALVSHSAGVIFLLNTLYRYPNLLHPQRPFVAMLGPWVDPAHSGYLKMRIVQRLPIAAILQRFGVKHRESIKASKPLLRQGTRAMQKSLNCCVHKHRNHTSITNGQACKDNFCCEVGAFEARRKTERSQEVAVNDEVLLCLKKVANGLWGACSDYEEFAKKLAYRHKEDTSPIKIELWSSDRDLLVGKKGRKYMEKCWMDNKACNLQSKLVDTPHNHLPIHTEVLKSVLCGAGGHTPASESGRSQSMP